jgi:hypothetical protein
MWKAKVSALAAASALTLSPGALAQDAAGKVLWVKGPVERISADGAVRPLAKGESVVEGDVVRTGAGGQVQLMMKDEALLALRPQSSLRIAHFQYQGREDGSERATIDLLKGGLRSITGAIGRTNKDNLKLRTDTVLVGVRGTDHETHFIPAGNEAGTYDRVTMGGTYLQNGEGRVDLDPGQSGFAPRAGASPSRLPATPAFMQLAALRNGNTGPQLRETSPGDEVRLQTPRGVPHNNGLIPSGNRSLPQQATVPVLPAQALGSNAGGNGGGNAGGNGGGWGKGGKCGGPCADPAGSKGKKP